MDNKVKLMLPCRRNTKSTALDSPSCAPGFPESQSSVLQCLLRALYQSGARCTVESRKL